MMTFAMPWLRRLDAEIARLRAKGSTREIDSRRLYALVDPPSQEAFVRAIAERIHQGIIRASYRVRSRETGTGIAEYPDMLSVPLEIEDPTADTRFKVEPFRDLEVVYRPSQA
jgi:hypothetical protein